MRNMNMLNRGALAAFVVLAFLPIGYISTSDMMNSWLGVEEAALIAEWGEPDKIIPDNASGRIFIYGKTDAYSSRGGNDSNIHGSGSIGSDIPGREMRWKRTYMFWLDNKSAVHNWDMQKEEIPYSAKEAENL